MRTRSMRRSVDRFTEAQIWVWELRKKWENERAAKNCNADSVKSIDRNVLC